MEQAWIGGSDAVPAQGVQKGRKLPGRVEALFADVLPRLLADDPPVELQIPIDGKLLALGIVIEAGKGNRGAVA